MLVKLSRRFMIEAAFALSLYIIAGAYFIKLEAFESLAAYVELYESWELDELILLLLLSPLFLLWLCLRLGLRAKREMDSRHKRELDSLKQLTVDPHTGLNNFSYFEKQLDELIHRADSGRISLFLISFTNHREVCEGRSVEQAEQFQLTSAQLLDDYFSKDFLIARTGQSELAVAFKCDTPQCYQQAFQRLLNLMNEIESSLPIGPIFQASIAYIDSGETLPSTRRLITRARSALFSQSGCIGAGVFVYDQEVEDQQRQQDKLLNELKRAIELDELELYYQPQVDLYVGLTVGSEALVRWNHPVLGLLTPPHFVHLLDHEEICLEFGAWLFAKAVARLDKLSHQYPDQSISINISASHIQHPAFFEQLTQALHGYSSSLVNRLVIEVTESFKLSDHDTAFTNMRKCKSLGAKVSLDDFGTGYSSLNQLRVLPIDEIKIDRAFVRNILTEPNDFKLVSSILSLAENFDIDVVTEGVENLNQIDKLIMVGCRKVQGYYYSQPVSEAEFDQWLKDSTVQPAIL